MGLSHYYDWTNGFSTDPACKDRLPYGHECKVSVNGEDVTALYIFRIMTGPTGWIEHTLYRDGRPVHEIVDTLTGKVYLDTDPDCPQWQQRSPGSAPRYVERNARRRIEGNVEFTYASPGGDGSQRSGGAVAQDGRESQQRTGASGAPPDMDDVEVFTVSEAGPER